MSESGFKHEKIKITGLVGVGQVNIKVWRELTCIFDSDAGFINDV